jgi:hypothetical protein
MFAQTDWSSVQDLHLPWSSHPSYPEETLNPSADYLAWFEFLLPEQPWDACIVLQGIGLLRHGEECLLDISTMIDMVELNFPETELADVNLFARMQLLGKLCEMALEKRWCMPALSDSNGVQNIATVQIVVDPDSERLAELIQRMLRQHSGVEDVTETRPYQYLHLLIIDHEMIQEHQIEDSRKVVIRILSRLNAIEKYATSSKIMDHRLAMEVIYHQYILKPRKDWRMTMLNKIAHFTSRFGKTQETLRLHYSFLRNINVFSMYCHPNCAYVVSKIIKFSEALDEIKDFRSGRDIGDKSPRRLQSIFETVLHTIGDQG